MNLSVKGTIEIAAPASRVWEVLTAPEQTAKYMFGCRTVSDWKPGSQLNWEGEFNGQKLVAVTGKILELQPNQRLSYSVFDPNGKYRDAEADWLKVTYALTPTAHGTRLDVEQGDFSRVEEGEQRYQQHVKEGWEPLLSKIKAIAEEG